MSILVVCKSGGWPWDSHDWSEFQQMRDALAFARAYLPTLKAPFSIRIIDLSGAIVHECNDANPYLNEDGN